MKIRGGRGGTDPVLLADLEHKVCLRAVLHHIQARGWGVGKLSRKVRQESSSCKG